MPHAVVADRESRELAAQRPEPCGRTIDAHPGSEAREHIAVVAGHRWRAADADRRRHRARQPDFALRVPHTDAIEAGRGDADNGEDTFRDGDMLTDDLCVSTENALPDVVIENRDWFSSQRGCLIGAEEPAECGHDAEQWKEICRDEGNVALIECAPLAHELHPAAPLGRNALEDVALVAQQVRASGANQSVAPTASGEIHVDERSEERRVG